MHKLFFFLFFLSLIFKSFAQLIEVRADYNAVGDCVFSAHNNGKTPLFLNIDFADLQNTTFNETLPFVAKVEPGFNNLFTLERDLDAGVPRFNYQMKTYRSDPTANVNLDFPYLIPFTPGSKINGYDVESILGFWGNNKPKSWVATGFKASSGTLVYSARQGQVVEIVGALRDGDPRFWYNAWPNAITLLQPDGTLVCYKNVIDKDNKLVLNQKIHAGELLGEVAPNSSEIVLLFYQNTLSSDDLLFIIPEFVTAPGERKIVNSVQTYEVVHPKNVRALEMTKREIKKLLNSKQ